MHTLAPTKRPSVWLCLLLDAVGAASYLIPVVGEWVDLLWAPLSALLFLKMFGGKVGKLGAFVAFAEELAPFTDIFPTFTLAYLYRRFFEKEE